MVSFFVKLIVIFLLLFVLVNIVVEGWVNYFDVKYVRVDCNGKGYVVFDKLLVNFFVLCGVLYKNYLLFNVFIV